MERSKKLTLVTEETKEKSSCDIVCCLVHAKVQTHLFHWQITGEGSAFAHAVLGDFYKSLDDLTDAYVETSMCLSDPPKDLKLESLTNFSSIKGIITFLMELLEEVIESRESQVETDLQNQLDEIQTLIKVTIFKLKRLND